MRIYLLALSILLSSSLSYAKEYGTYDPKRILTVSESPSGKKYGFDTAYLDLMLNDLALHAKNYPPKFDTPQDQQRAIRDVKTLSGMLDILINGPTPNPELLVRAGYLNSIGYNLDINKKVPESISFYNKSTPVHLVYFKTIPKLPCP